VIPTAKSDSTSLITSLLKVVISAKKQLLTIRDLSDLTLQIAFNGWWASMNIGAVHPIAWKNSSDASSWQFYFHCGIVKPGSPGMIYLVCHPVLRHLSEPVTS
jgi:hypothetical protein